MKKLSCILLCLIAATNLFAQTAAIIDNAENPSYSPDSAYIAFTRNNDLYTFRVADRKEIRLTFDGNDTTLNGRSSWVCMEEIFGRPSRYKAFWWSPDSRRLVFFRTDETGVPLFTVTDSPGQNGYVETLRYPKPGNKIPTMKAGIVNAEGGDIVWAQIEDKQEAYLGLPYWRPDSKAVWLQWIDRAQQNYKILETTIDNGAVRQLYAEHQDTWISIDDEPRIRFLESGKGFILQSDKSGWSHLYLHDMNGKLVNPITSGSYTVLKILDVNEKGKMIYFTCYKDNIGSEDFYAVQLDGKKLQRLSFGNFSHKVMISADKKYFTTTYSNASTPPVTDKYTIKGKFVAREKAADTVVTRAVTEFISIKSTDGKFDLPMRIIRPLNMEKGKVYPVKINVYGGPGNMLVRNNWVALNDDNQQYAQDGLIQVIMDHRGSGHNGKIGQNDMYRNLGYREIKDYTRCVQWLINNLQADSTKVMITGFSYGGYITAYALTYGADVFTHGIAGGSVTDWGLYDAIYTERYMGTPQNNPEGYKNSSVINHADRLEGRLLLTHGLRDENVHAQNTFRLAAAFQDLGKVFELMIYPESRHGYRGTKAAFSRGEDRRFIYEHLLEKPVPEEETKRLGN